MLVVEKIINKRISTLPMFEVKNNRIQFFFDNKKHFVSIEKIDKECFLYFIDKSFLDDLVYLLGIERSILSDIIMNWFFSKMKIKKIVDLEDKFQLTQTCSK
jgi:hypothetical protein